MQTWHYGLIAQWWAAFNVASPDEVAFYRHWIEAGDGPALDLACGTGRLLLPLRRAGLQVDGCDISADMTALCRERAQREQLNIHVFEQAMHELDCPQRYRTVFICDSFGIGGDRRKDQRALERIRQQLEPGGTFVLTHTLPYVDPRAWRQWPLERRAPLPQPWPEWAEGRVLESGDTLALNSRVEAFDPLQQLLTLQMRARLLRDGELLREEEHRLVEVLYFHNELRDMLEHAGFTDIRAFAADSHRPATGDSVRISLIARA